MVGTKEDVVVILPTRFLNTVSPSFVNSMLSPFLTIYTARFTPDS